MRCALCGKKVWIGIGRNRKFIGIFVSEKAQCKPPMELIRVPNPRNPEKTINVCRLGPKVRRFDAPAGKPAYRKLRRGKGIEPLIRLKV